MTGHRHNRLGWLGVLVGLVLSGCGGRDFPGTAAESTAAAGTGSDPSGSGSTSHGLDRTGAPVGDSSTGRGAVFIVAPDGGPVPSCSLWDQDCPLGEKCLPWANDGGGSWNAYRCSPVDPDPDAVGESCTVVDHAASGVDSCDYGAMCWDVDASTNTGTCRALCAGTEHNPLCDDPDEHCNGNRHIALCVASCCPLVQDCPPGHACYNGTVSFECVVDVSGDGGAFGDPCEFLNVCDPGLICIGPHGVPGCIGSGCCSVLCSLADADPTSSCPGADQGQECLPWFDDGDAPPGEAHIGICTVPW